MADSEQGGLATDITAGNAISGQAVSRVASRRSSMCLRFVPQVQNVETELIAHTIRPCLIQEDAEQQVDIIKADNGDSSSLSSSNSLEPTTTSDKIIVSFTDDDPENPYTWAWVCNGYCIGQ
jgi:hypothetical protein